MSNWKETLKSLKSLSSVEKDDSDRNAKIEAALNAQGRKTAIPAEAHEALSSWWQSKGKASLTPEQSQRMQAIKEPKERRAKFAIVKSEDKLSYLKKSLEYLKEAVLSDLFKAKAQKQEWSASREYSPSESSAMKPHLDAGHSVQEAAHLSGVEKTPQNHPYKISALSPAMAVKAKAAAMDWIGRSKQRDASEATAAVNPEKFAAGKAAEIHSSGAAASKSYGDSLKEHKSSIQHMSPQDQIASVQKFKSEFHASPAAKLAHVDASKAHSDIRQEAKTARGQELYEQRKNIILGGQGIGDTMSTSTASAMDDQENPLDESDMEDIRNG